MSGEWHAARAALEAAVVAAVKRFEDETGCRLAIEVRYENPAADRAEVATRVRKLLEAQG
jgi:hypothetical protein